MATPHVPDVVADRPARVVERVARLAHGADGADEPYAGAEVADCRRIYFAA